MKLNLTHTSLCLAALLSLSSCGLIPSASTSAPVDTARCILASATAADLQKAGGQSAAPNHAEITLARFSSGSCPGRVSFVTSNEYRIAVTKVYRKIAVDRPEYRAGQYAGIPGVPLAEQSRIRAAELGTLLEQVFQTRSAVVRCNRAEPEAVALVSQLDATLTLAVMGRYLGINDFNTAKVAAADLLERAGSHASRAKPLACNDALETGFKSHVLQWSQFYAGEHPWAPGCSVTPEAEVFVLKCLPARVG